MIAGVRSVDDAMMATTTNSIMLIAITVALTTAVELSVEWLWEVREKLLAHEYIVLLATVSWMQMLLSPSESCCHCSFLVCEQRFR